VVGVFGDDIVVVGIGDSAAGGPQPAAEAGLPAVKADLEDQEQRR